MAGSVNKVILVGNLGVDPELKGSGESQVAKLRIATNHRRKQGDGSWSEEAEWHNVVAFGRQAELARDYLVKGKQVYVEGYLKTSQWEQEGTKRYKTEVVARSIQFLGKKDDVVAAA